MRKIFDKIMVDVAQIMYDVNFEDIITYSI